MTGVQTCALPISGNAASDKWVEDEELKKSKSVLVKLVSPKREQRSNNG